MKEEHEHDYAPMAYFCAEKDEDEWLILECNDCEVMVVVRGKSVRVRD